MAQSRIQADRPWIFGAWALEFGRIYRTGRPSYPLALYDMICDYHRSEGTDEWKVLQLVGTRLGFLSQALATSFNSTVCIDTGMNFYSWSDGDIQYEEERNVVPKFAPDSFGALVSDKYEFLDNSSCEWLDGIDLIAVGKRFPFRDVDLALDSFHELLKPGGTLAYWAYGRPTIVEDDGSLDGPAQKAFDELMTAMVWKCTPLGMQTSSRVQSQIDQLTGWYENLRFDNGVQQGRWSKVVRKQWNRDRPMSLVRMEDFFAQPPQALPMSQEQRDFEEVHIIDDRDFFTSRYSEARFWDFIMSMFLDFGPTIRADPRFERLRDALRDAMGGEDARMKVIWPLTLILATKS